MSESVEANGYEFFFESERLQPSIGQGRITHEVKVIRIYDRRNGQKMFDNFTGRYPCLGSNEREAFEKAAARAREWAEAQR